MKKYVVLAAILGAAYLLYDIQSVKQVANEALRGGTLKGVEACVAYSESGLVSAETTRNACSARFQRRLFDGDYATGRAGPKFVADNVKLEGSLENKLTSHVTTWVALRFRSFDADGKETEFLTDTYTWIEPRSFADFSVTLTDLTPEEVRDLEFCDHDDDTPESCISWGVVEIRGIEI